MIISKLQGGLGNQMFQYALGRSLAERFDTTLKLDLSFFDTAVNGYRAHQEPSADTIFFQLENFAIKADAATERDIERTITFGRLGKQVATRLTSPKVARFYPTARQRYAVAGRFFNHYREREADWWRFNPAVLDAGPDCHLEGYWECPRYFKEFRSTLESEFRPSRSLSSTGQRLAARIEDTQSVGIHVRRGDFVKYGNALPREYFETAIDQFDSDDVTFFVFSVDTDWAREQLSIPDDSVYVDHLHPEDGQRTPQAYEYFELLTKCTHKIISNSTFSWWAAWLNHGPETEIYYPEIWRPANDIGEMRCADSRDLIPASWTVVEWD